MDAAGRARLAENLACVRDQIARAAARAGRSATEITLVAITKYVGADVAVALVELGQRDLGESRPQVLWDKAAKIPAPARWHLVGNLQTNKVKRTLPLVSMIHSVDRFSIAEAIDKEATRLGLVMPIALEVNVSGEASKHGFSPDEVKEQFESLAGLSGLSVAGLMTMAPLEGDESDQRRTFSGLRNLRDELKRQSGGTLALDVLSMGMSGDFEIAIEEGATLVRVGSALFEGLTP